MPIRLGDMADDNASLHVRCRQADTTSSCLGAGMSLMELLARMRCEGDGMIPDARIVLASIEASRTALRRGISIHGNERAPSDVSRGSMRERPVDQASLTERLAEAVRHVEMGSQRVIAQESLIARLALEGHDATIAKRLLANLRDARRLHKGHLEIITAEVGVGQVAADRLLDLADAGCLLPHRGLYPPAP